MGDVVCPDVTIEVTQVVLIRRIRVPAGSADLNHRLLDYSHFDLPELVSKLPMGTVAPLLPLRGRIAAPDTLANEIEKETELYT